MALTTPAVLGASGYIGGRLVEALREHGVSPRLLGRRPDALTLRWPWADVAHLDVTKPDTIEPALASVGTAYYLVHAMAAGEAGFAERDREAARAFGVAAAEAGVERIVYLGGLGSSEDTLSEHLQSRQETGRQLAAAGTPVLELRAGMVIGAGSASFRMLNDLVKRLPLMVTPRWVATRSQPIAIRDVVSYLIAAAAVPLIDRPPDRRDRRCRRVVLPGDDAAGGCIARAASDDRHGTGAQPAIVVPVVRPGDVGADVDRAAADRRASQRDDRT